MTKFVSLLFSDRKSQNLFKNLSYSSRYFHRHSQCLMSTKFLKLGDFSFSKMDEEFNNILKDEEKFQKNIMDMNPSEIFTLPAVLEVTSSCFDNNPGYYGYPNSKKKLQQENSSPSQFSHIHLDLCEFVTQRALSAFKLRPTEWRCNVASLSPAMAALQVFTALLEPNSHVLSLCPDDLGLHYLGGSKHISSKFWDFLPYNLFTPFTEKNNQNDINHIQKGQKSYWNSLIREEFSYLVKVFKPKMVTIGSNLISLAEFKDFRYLRDMADQYQFLLYADISCFCGFVCHGLTRQNPFEFCDVVTMSTHQGLGGPNGALIFFREDGTSSLEAINDFVFPGTQGTHHSSTIAAIGLMMKLLQSDDNKNFYENVLFLAKNLRTQIRKRTGSIFEVMDLGSTDQNYDHIVSIRPNLDSIDVQQIAMTLAKKEKILVRCLPGNRNILQFGLFQFLQRFGNDKDYLMKRKIDDLAETIIQVLLKHDNVTMN